MVLVNWLKFTPLEFETWWKAPDPRCYPSVKIYSVGVWNASFSNHSKTNAELKFTPLEFETQEYQHKEALKVELKFTPLEFETHYEQLFQKQEKHR